MNIHPFLDDDLRDQAAQYVLGMLDEMEARSLRLHLSLCSCCRAEVAALLPVSRVLCLLYPTEAPPPELWTRVVARIDEVVRAGDDARIGEPNPPPSRGSEPRFEQNLESSEATAHPLRADIGAKAQTETSDRGPGASALRTQVWKGWAESSARSPLVDFTYVSGSTGEWEATAVDGVEARRLFVDADGDRATFLVRMGPGAAYPAHVHAGPEECFVLQGDLTVGHQRMRAGDYQRAEPGSTHGVQSTEEGCVLLIVSSLGDEILA